MGCEQCEAMSSQRKG